MNERFEAAAKRKEEKLKKLAEMYKKVDYEEEQALAVRDAKFGKKEDPNEVVGRMQARQAVVKRKWD